MALLKNCCCFDIRTGAMILGWLGLVSNIANFVFGVTLKSAIVIPEQDQDKIDPEVLKQLLTSLQTSVISTAVVGVLMNCALIYGAHKNQRLFLLPWLITHGIAVLTFTLAVSIGGLVCFFASSELAPIGAAIYVIGLPLAGLDIYFWLSVLSLYQRFSEEEILNKRRAHEEVGFLPAAPQYQQMKSADPPAYKDINTV